MNHLMTFWQTLRHSFGNLLPIVLVVGLFQVLVIRQVPDNLGSMLVGLGIVVFGVAIFLQGLDLGIFPVGKSLSNAFARRGSLPLLMIFGFSIGFAAVVAEPALIAVAEQAQTISEGRIDALILRLLVALSVGLVVALGVLRTLLGHPLHWYMICGYLLVVTVTFFAPEEIVGLAYDSGGVTTNIVTVPLIAALGVGLASSIKGRNPLAHGFGLVALAVMVPMIAVQLYGIVVYTLLPSPALHTQLSDSVAAVAGPAISAVGRQALTMLFDLLGMLRDVLPIILVILFFQYAVIRKSIPYARRVVLGFAMVILGLYAFVVGLKLGLFPVGRSMAEQLIALDTPVWIYLFAFAIGFATTMAEPALIAIGAQAEEAAHGKLNARDMRLLVAIGVAVGVTVGVHRIISGDSFHYYIMGGCALMIIMTLLTPRFIVPLAYDLGGVTVSAVTVPMVTAVGIALATHIEGRSVLIDGFGLIAFATISPIITVMLYAIVMARIKPDTGETT